MEDSLYVQVEDDLFGEDWLNSFATTLLDAKYEKADILEVVNNQKQLNTTHRNDLFRILKKHASLFDGTLGVHALFGHTRRVRFIRPSTCMDVCI